MARFLTCSFIVISGLLSSVQAAQTCDSQIPYSAPNSRYSNNGDGTITDKQTGLMWKQCVEGVSGINSCSTGNSSTYNWQQALQAPAALNTQGGYAGYTDWRLPNIKELSSLTERACVSPAINLSMFPNTSLSGVWSSSPSNNGLSYAWNADTDNYANVHSYSRFNVSYTVRLVRSGQ